MWQQTDFSHQLRAGQELDANLIHKVYKAKALYKTIKASFSDVYHTSFSLYVWLTFL